MEQDYAFSIAELVNSLIKKHMKTIVLTVKCSETSFLIESSTKYLPLTKKNKINLCMNEFHNIDGEVIKEREAVFFDALQESLVKIAIMNPKILITLYEEDELDNRNLAFITKHCNNLPEKVVDLKKIKLSFIFLVSFESKNCDVEFCFFDVVDNNTNPSYVFTAGYLNHTITKSFELQFNGHNIGFIGVINTDKRIILDWCVPIIIEKLRSSLCSAEAEMNARSLLDEPRGYRKLCKDKAGSITAVVDLTENIVKDRINDPEVLEQFHNEIVCSSIESSCCDLPIVYDKELKAWQSGWDEQCLKVKKGNQESTIKWIESSDFTIKPDIEQFNETSETIDDTFSSAITNKRKSLYSTYVPSLKPFAEDDPDKFKFKLPSLITPKKSIIMIPENSINMIPENSTNMIPENSINMIPENSINMIPENSKLFSHKDIANLNSKKKETECREVGKLAIKTVNEQSINDYKIPSLYSTLVPSAPQQRSPIRPRSSQSILSIDRSAKKYRDLLNSSSSSEHKRKVDNDVDDVVFVGETKKKPSSNDENNNGPKKHKLYIPTEDDELILIEDADRPSTSSSSKNRFKLFKTKNTRLQGIPNRCDLTNSSFSTSRSRYNRHNKR